MGSKGSQTTTTDQSQTYSPNAPVGQAGSEAINRALQVSSQPFQMPQAPVAGFNPFQQQAFNQTQNMQGMTQPYFDQASQNFTNAGQAVTPQETASYMNPYADAALQNMQKYIFDPQRRQTMGQARQQAGGVGADRLALTQQNLDKTQADALGQAQAGFYSNAMAQAQRAKEMQLASGQQFQNLGTTAQNANLQATGALGTAGAQQQAQTQRELMSPYQQELARLAYPFQTTQFLAGITGGLAPAMGGTTTGHGTTTQPSPSVLNQILGIGTAGVGLAGSTGMFNSWNPWGSTAQGGEMAEGGEVEANDSMFPSLHDQMSIIPQVNLPMGGGQNTGAKLDLNPKQPSGGTGKGSGVGDIAKMAMMFINRGGRIPAATGGPVNPWDVGRGFALGGDTFDDRYPSETPPVTYPPSYMAALPAPSMEMPDATPNDAVENRFPQAGEIQPNSFVNNPAGAQALNARAAQLRPASQQPLQSTPVKTLSFQPPAGPQNPQITANPQAQPPGDQPIVTPDGVTLKPLPQRPPDPSINSDLTPERMGLPRERQPYPDATDRNWGQNFARSPWLALVEAGAKMAQTRGPIGSAIGAGLQAGAQTLGTQRKELRSEEQINQKADQLYRQATQEVNKYTRMTPYQKAHLEQSKYQQGYFTDANGKPLSFDTKSGKYFHPDTGQPLAPGEKVLSRRTPTTAWRETAIAQIRKENPALTYSEALAMTQRAPQGDMIAVRKENMALSAAKADIKYATQPLPTIAKYRKMYGLPPLPEQP